MPLHLDLVANDTPDIVFDLVSDQRPLDVSDEETVVAFKSRRVGETDVIVITCDKLPGWQPVAGGPVFTDPPYDVAGVGGRCVARCSASTFNAAGDYEAEIEITRAGGRISTVYDIVHINVRADF